jgi:hypothetical protein
VLLGIGGGEYCATIKVRIPDNQDEKVVAGPVS